MNTHALLQPRSGAELRNPMLDLEFAQLTDTGRVRDHNEDYFGFVTPSAPEEIRSHGWFFALADGVGGQDKGEAASRTAVESVLAGFRAATAGEPHAAVLARIVQQANTQVFEAGLAAKSPGRAMATTLVACAFRYDRVVVAHVGDSRCYLIRRGQANILTRDHTVAGEQVRMGILSSKEAANAPTRHVLSRSLGNDMFVAVETSEHNVLADDVLLLCSDGLHGPVSPEQIASIVGQSSDLAHAAQKLVDAANQQDGSDNVSVQLVRIKSVERVGMYRGRPYRLR